MEIIKVLGFSGATLVLNIKAIYTPGHTSDSYSFLMNRSVFFLVIPC